MHRRLVLAALPALPALLATSASAQGTPPVRLFQLRLQRGAVLRQDALLVEPYRAALPVAAPPAE